MKRVEERRALVADVDLPAEYAKAALSVAADLVADLDYAKADARHWHQGWVAATADVERQHGWLKELSERYDLALLRERAAKEDAATHAEREGVQEGKAREFARQAREGEALRRKIRAFVNAPEGLHEYNAPNAQADLVKHCVAFTTTDTLRAALEDAASSVCFCGKRTDEHPPGPPCPPPPPPGFAHG